jgi:molybdopterin converting factor small subunit
MEEFISVQFCGSQRAVTRTNDVVLPLTGEDQVKDILNRINHSFPDLTLDERDITVSVNNEMSNLHHTLNANDTIAFLPHIGGG